MILSLNAAIERPLRTCKWSVRGEPRQSTHYKTEGVSSRLRKTSLARFPLRFPMSKRKVGTGGYPESSDDSDASSRVPSKKTKSYKPPTVDMMKAATNTCLLPRLNTLAPSARPSQPPNPIALPSSWSPFAKPLATASHIPT